MPTYSSKPTTIEAFQYRSTLGTTQALIDWMSRVMSRTSAVYLDLNTDPVLLWVEKSKAWCELKTNDFVVLERDLSGFYPCDKEVFLDRWEINR